MYRSARGTYQERVQDETVEDTDAEGLPVGRMVGGYFGHAAAAGVGEAGARPLVVGGRVKTQRGLLAFYLDLFP